MNHKEYPEQEDMLPLELDRETEGFFPEEEPEYQDASFVPLYDQQAQDAPLEYSVPVWKINPEAFVPEEDWTPLPQEPADADLDESAAEEEPDHTEEVPLEPEEETPSPAEPDPLELELLEVSQLLDAQPQERSVERSPAEPAPEQEAIPEAPQERIPKKGRPRRKQGEGLLGIPNILVTLVWLAITVAIGVTLGRMLWVCAADVLAFGREDRAVTITVYESDTIEDIADKLHRSNLIRYPGLFKLYAKLAVDEGEIRPGIWDLNTRYDYHALVSMMSPSSNRKVIEIMIPEGYSCRQIFALLEENKVCTQADLAAYAANGELEYYWFLEGVTRGEETCLEGFLFPDTYQFYTNDSPKNVLERMLDNFGNRFTDEMAAMLPQLNAHISDMMAKDGRSQEYIDAHQLSLRDLVIVASLIEKETSSAEEGHVIASVIYNRLFSWGDTPAYLNIDATMVYALGKTDITAEDMKIDHPYNTYLYTGLTPGPIANPGLASLKAALEPDSTNYYYYVLDPAAGSHHFSTTYEEHQAFIASLGE